VLTNLRGHRRDRRCASSLRIMQADMRGARRTRVRGRDALPSRAMKIATWNVNGIRARHGQLVDWLAEERPDVVCLQELKASPEQIPEALTGLPDYASHWHGGAVKGYAGVSLHLRRETFGAQVASFAPPPFDHECRAIETVIATRAGKARLWSIYAPNGGKDYDAKLDFFEALIARVAAVHAAGEHLVLAGDLNIAREERDVHPSQRKPDVIGQRPEERALFARLLAAGLRDVGRALHPDDERLFTWWPMWKGARERNLGWRLDYVLVSEAIADGARTSVVRRAVGTSDHAPVVVELDLALTA
jgi:exodeoxyribonuclease-3